MGNVDGVPVASQVKSIVQASRGENEAAWATQGRFTRRCIGAAQVRSVIEAAQGDVTAAAETQRTFLENTRRILNPSEVADAVPVVAQVKSLAAYAGGERDVAVRTQDNFTRRCPVVSQVRSAYEAVTHSPEEAVRTQREFLNFASGSLDKVPGLGHAKALLHHSLGDHNRGNEALNNANLSAQRGSQLIGTALIDIFHGRSGGAADPRAGGSANQFETGAHCTAVGALSEAQINDSTLCFIVCEDQCASHGACPICMQDFAVGDTATTLRCFHIFHTGCAERWLRENGNCPVCRIRALPNSHWGPGMAI